MKNPLVGAFVFAFIASVGNALFVYGQRKSIPSESPFLFLILSLLLGILILSLASLFFPKPDFYNAISQNYKSILFTGIGISITYIGFYFLYNKFGATYYILYAILSFMTTSIIVGIGILKEQFNFYYILSIILAILTIFFFFLGKQQSS